MVVARAERGGRKSRWPRPPETAEDRDGQVRDSDNMPEGMRSRMVSSGREDEGVRGRKVERQEERFYI